MQPRPIRDREIYEYCALAGASRRLAPQNGIEGAGVMLLMSRDETRAPKRPTSGELGDEQICILDGAVDRLVRLGERAGVNPEQMVVLLDSGMEIHELALYLASRVPRAS
jgi:hypothetical protein